MIISIDGLQLVGKSTVLEPLFEQYNHYKYPTGNICKTMNINITWEFQVAKDIALLDMNKDRMDVILLDRGPLSTVFYSLLFKRTTEDNIRHYIQSMLKNYRSVWRPVWLSSINAPLLERNKNDNFDNLQKDLTKEDYDNSLLLMESLFRDAGIKVNKFQNDFSQPVEYNKAKFSEFVLDIELGMK